MAAKNKTRKVLGIEVDGYTLVCVRNYDKTENPYHLNVKWFDEKPHTLQVARYPHLFAVMCAIIEWMHDGYHGFAT